MSSVIKKIFGTSNDRIIKGMRPRVAAINALEPAIQALSDDELRGKTAEFRGRLAQGEKLDALLPEAFAVVREAGWRVLGMRHFDVQLIGGMVLHSGKIAEMRTGEGKTLVATLPAYLNALVGKGVHIVTVNDYLANRDAEWMGKIYRFLGLTVGTIVHGYDDGHKQRQYAADITYGTNSEFGFDYLRDNMKYSLSEYTQSRGLHYAIIDEVDSILIDEARTPLIISGPAEESAEKYIEVNKIVSRLRPERDYIVDEKSKSAMLTDAGTDAVESMLSVGNLFSPENSDWFHHVTKALAAHACYKRDVDYLVHAGEVLIIDEHTGRTMEGRRWSDGLHQAIEAKEEVPIQRESVTLATITYQNLYRMYDKLSGMTGTADTEAEEFDKIYKLSVVVVPTNKPMARKDYEDVVYKTEAEKFAAVVEDIKERYEKGQPVLVGTKNVDKSEILSRLLRQHKIEHITLNAKFHRQEGEIIAQAGQAGAVTISTNMAGRGTDILLGGNPEYLARAEVAKEEAGASDDPAREQAILAEFRWLSGDPESIPTELISSERAAQIFQEKMQARRGERLEDGTVADARAEAAEEARAWVARIVESYAKHLEVHRAACAKAKEEVLQAGGLHVLGTERHESRRVDNQLRGRAGRQGDPGSSMFYLSLEDDLMRIFGGDRLRTMMERLGMEDDVPIESRMVTKSIANAQKRVEGHNFDIRKNLIEYDDVMNLQRKAVYALRKRVLGHDDMSEDVLDMVERVILHALSVSCPPGRPDDWDWTLLGQRLHSVFGAEYAFQDEDAYTARRDELEMSIFEGAEKTWLGRQGELGAHFVVVEEGLVPKNDVPVTAQVVEPVWRYLLRQIFLDEIDRHWRDHLTQMEHLREGIHLRSYGSKDPKVEYKREGHELFSAMMREIDYNVLEKLFHIRLVSPDEIARAEEQKRRAAAAMQRAAQLSGGDSEAKADAAPKAPSGDARRTKRPGRNDPCWCGSGKKYKKCHLREDEQVRA